MLKKILVIDDSATVRHQLRTFLGSNGFAVIEAENGALGVASAREHNPDLLIIDVNMPVMNGVEAVAKVRELPGQQKTPIFMLTTESSKSMIASGKAAGATAWMVKPFKPEVLLMGVKKVLGLQ